MTERSIREIEEMGEGKYINPYTDFGFKKLFGTPLNKDLLISFLNSLFEGKEVVRDLTYLNGENLGNGYGDRRAIFDVTVRMSRERRSSLRCRRLSNSSLRTEVYSIPLFLSKIKVRKEFGILNLKGSIQSGFWISSFPIMNIPKTVSVTR